MATSTRSRTAPRSEEPVAAPPIPTWHPRLAEFRKVWPESECRALELWCSTFFPYQLDWALDPATFAICCKSRQIGISHTTSFVGVLWGAFLGETTTFISETDVQSMEILDKAKRHARALQMLGSDVADMGSDNKHHIWFHKTGGQIVALPSTGGRSFSGNVFLDEFAYQKHARKVWDAAIPAALLGDFRVRVVSTPNGVGNEFHDLWEIATDPGKKMIVDGQEMSIPWSPHLIPLKVAMGQGFPVSLAKCWTMAKHDQRLFDQMFNCSFLDAILQYIPHDVVEACCVDYADLPSHGNHFAGLDVGKEVDLTVLTVLREWQGRRWVVHVESMKRTDEDGMHEMVARAFERFRIKRLCVDATGIGAFPAERIKKRHSEAIDVSHRRPKVELIDFTLQSKEMMATSLFSAFNDELLKLPRTESSLPQGVWSSSSGIVRQENATGWLGKMKRAVSSIMRVVTDAGNVRYDAPRTAEGHADHAWSLALANLAVDAVHPAVEALRRRMGLSVVK